MELCSGKSFLLISGIAELRLALKRSRLEEGGRVTSFPRHEPQILRTVFFVPILAHLSLCSALLSASFMFSDVKKSYAKCSAK